jgi:hypothetical protein
LLAGLTRQSLEVDTILVQLIKGATGWQVLRASNRADERTVFFQCLRLGGRVQPRSRARKKLLSRASICNVAPAIQHNRDDLKASRRKLILSPGKFVHEMATFTALPPALRGTVGTPKSN